MVDAVSPIPVIAAGGIADGRGLAAQGINIGTRFVASTESGVADEWKRAIVAAESEDTVKISFAEHVAPPVTEGGWPTLPRSLRTPFIDAYNDRPEEAARQADRLRKELMDALSEGEAHELIPLTGETAGLIKDVIPAVEIVRRMIEGAEQAFASMEDLIRA
ncbi:MAG: NAD(P)H-dependent flavin oxidoreductase [Acidimicrobiales bacterium]